MQLVMLSAIASLNFTSFVHLYQLRLVSAAYNKERKKPFLKGFLDLKSIELPFSVLPSSEVGSQGWDAIPWCL